MSENRLSLILDARRIEKRGLAEVAARQRARPAANADRVPD
ncbi:hypothetical protein [Nocardiopsis dassonvillei]|nr:hypothetical protein [Nocardiopsis dassonvillei]